MIYAAISYWIIGVPLAYALGLPMGYGGEGIWAGLAVGLAGAGVVFLIRFWRIASRLGNSATT